MMKMKMKMKKMMATPSMTRCGMCLIALCLGGAPAFAARPGNPLMKDVTALYEGIRLNLVETAELVSPADYTFRPTPEVRSIGELIGHIASAQFSFCAGATGATNPNTVNFEKAVSDKPGLVKALKDSFAYCDGVYASMTDAAGMEMIRPGESGVTRMSRLIFNVIHDNEHYGNLVTYMRLKGMVPPSTARSQSGQ